MKQRLIFCGIGITFILLTGCQSGNRLQNYYLGDIQASEFLDDKFIGYKNILIETETEIFALSTEMKVMAKSMSLERDARQKATKLLQHFFSPEDINLAYESGANVIAAQAFKNQAANCLSLTIMAYAIAQEAKLSVAFQRVDVPEYWVRNGRVNMLTGHINLTVLDEKFPDKRLVFQRTGIEIDFDPFVNKMPFEKHKINKNTVLAMFYNNKAATAMVNGDYITAYAYLKKATQVDPLFSSAWGNLGILYRFNGYQQSAIDTYRYAISLNHHNLTSMANLSMLLHAKGSYEEAKRLDSYIIRKRANNPYYYALLGDEKFYQGAYKEALNHYKKAIKLNKNIHEFYFGLAKVYYMLDEVGKAKTYIKKAMAKNNFAQLDKQYLVKLTILNQNY
ncbi:tetratricopeptide repeat protein [Colwellia sp. MB3u-70]|uniref:tetratricopeptide repeat protein n=1 Tax=unclassified Colwellia TaxID=196834 RepID=UPI0015F57987|nr:MULTISPECIES: tetratricopeptide repeat protein [unclassified Colwellia]MBA6291319.1 tetratricopeptide repeat protein [Colwellia sp. MB3u-8]MBA6307265.1 tetratricopeptide repeat protein [Colwellia sp. MB3u-70]